MTTTAMKRAGQLVAHLDILHQIQDVRQLLLLQLSMRERQDQVALFRRQGEAVTLSLIGTQPAVPTEELRHRAGSAQAAALLGQLQDISGIRGDDVAFSGGQIAEIINAQTRKIEGSDELARLDAALLGLIGKLEQQQGEQENSAPAEATAPVAEATPDEAPEEPAAEADAAEPEEEGAGPETSSALGRSRRRSA